MDFLSSRACSGFSPCEALGHAVLTTWGLFAAPAASVNVVGQGEQLIDWGGHLG